MFAPALPPETLTFSYAELPVLWPPSLPARIEHPGHDVSPEIWSAPGIVGDWAAFAPGAKLGESHAVGLTQEKPRVPGS